PDGALLLRGLAAAGDRSLHLVACVAGACRIACRRTIRTDTESTLASRVVSGFGASAPSPCNSLIVVSPDDGVELSPGRIRAADSRQRPRWNVFVRGSPVAASCVPVAVGWHSRRGCAC